jgi:molybdopterin/thiamine biosynthesis adenylyltransferase
MQQTKRKAASLKKKHVVIVGVGALGSASAQLLADAGVGKITLIDRDCVEPQNLERQRLYNLNDVCEAKATAAVKHLKK